MKEQVSETITFIPERLNKQPSVYRGMTISELFIVAAIGVGIGMLIGIITMLFYPNWVMIPTCMVIMGFLSIRFGGLYVSRLKRGKPDTWLERFVEFKRSPSRFITSENYWSLKRTKQPYSIKKGK